MISSYLRVVPVLARGMGTMWYVLGYLAVRRSECLSSINHILFSLANRSLRESKTVRKSACFSISPYNVTKLPPAIPTSSLVTAYSSLAPLLRRIPHSGKIQPKQLFNINISEFILMDSKVTQACTSTREARAHADCWTNAS